MYKKIYVPVDNSELSNEAVNLSVKMGVKDGAQLTGSHVYAAKLHDQRFRTMESGLPAQYHEEQELEKQRKIHDSLITKGLELITDSYLGVMATQCQEEGIEFQGASLEGKNWQELIKDIEGNDYDLIVMGAHGLGRVPGSLLGSVTERVARRVKRDLLVVKKTEKENQSDTIVVCLDGSDRSYGALKAAMALAVKFDKKLVALSAFDPYYHYVMFDSLRDVLSDKARDVFKFEEQEKLHEDIIDSGLAKVYQSNLDIATRIAEDEKIDITTKLLDGKAWQKLLEYVEKCQPWLMVIGRTGIHNEDDIDLGSNAENLLRMVSCNLFLVNNKFRPPIEYQADETMTWTKEATAKMTMVPQMAKGVAMKAIQQHAVAVGHTMITSRVVDEAIRKLLPPESIKAMGIVFDDEKEDDGKKYDLFSLTFECPSCKYVHHEERPEKCPVCGKGGEAFTIIDSVSESETETDGGVTETTFDGRKLSWSSDAKVILDGITEEVDRKQIRLKLEKQAHVRHQTTITKEMVMEAMGMAPAEGELQWTDEAVERLARVPQGFMRNAAKSKIEAYAGEISVSTIDLKTAEEGLAKARAMMMKSMKGGEMSHPDSIPRSSSKEDHGEGLFECIHCGFMVDGAEPENCDSCGKADYKKISAGRKDDYSAAAFKVIQWEDDAKAILERAPEGFMRDMSRNRIEQWARKSNFELVTKEIVEDKYASWKEGTAGIKSEMAWSDDAKKRVEKIPDFIRPMVMKEIERQSEGSDEIDVAILDSILKQWAGKSAFHG